MDSCPTCPFNCNIPLQHCLIEPLWYQKREKKKKTIFIYLSTHPRVWRRSSCFPAAAAGGIARIFLPFPAQLGHGWRLYHSLDQILFASAFFSNARKTGWKKGLGRAFSFRKCKRLLTAGGRNHMQTTKLAR